MNTPSLRLRAFIVAAGIAILASAGWAAADPPSRVARLGYLSGAVSFSPAGEDDWMRANINRPVTTGDRLWVDSGGRAELQVGGGVVRMNGDTGVSILNLDDRIAQLQLTQGSLNIRVRRLGPNQVFEVATPNLAFTVRRPGAFRIEVDPDGEATTILVRKGQGEVYGEGMAYVVDSRQPYRFTGTDLRDGGYRDMPRSDDFDRWSDDRDRRYDSSISARYVSQDVIGYQDLDANGTWRVDATYGNVWYPSRVGSDWAPYRDGHWSWIDPWGWTWVDDAPWGFAVSHYGRWANVRGSWGWVPGPVRSRAYYAPALVAFVGGSNFQLTISSGRVGGVAWFPLGPREVYRPSYQVSRGYFENVNRSNTVINNTVINNYYNNTNVTNVVYANQQVSGAIVAMPATAFVQSQPVSRSAVRVTRDMVASAPVMSVPSIAPTQQSVRGTSVAGDKPPSRVFERPAVARTAPPAPRPGFDAQRSQLAAQPGKPLDEATRQSLKPVRAAPAPAVTVVEQARKAPPTSRPPQAVDSGAKPVQRAQPEQRDKPGQPARDEPRAKPVQQKPPQAEPREKPVQQQPAQAEPRAKPVQRQPAQAEPRGKPDKQPVQAEPRAKPVQQQPAQAEPRAKPAQQQPAKAEPRAKPVQQQPAQAEPRGKPAQQPAQAAPRGKPAQQPAQAAPRGKPDKQPAQAEPQGKPDKQPAQAAPRTKETKPSGGKQDDRKNKDDDEEERGKKKN